MFFSMFKLSTTHMHVTRCERLNLLNTAIYYNHVRATFVRDPLITPTVGRWYTFNQYLREIWKHSLQNFSLEKH